MKRLSFDCRFWKNKLERDFIFCDVEISFSHVGTFDVLFYGSFVVHSRFVDGVEHHYFFKIFDDGRITYTLIR